MNFETIKAWAVKILVMPIPAWVAVAAAVTCGFFF